MSQVKALVDAYDAFIKGCKTDGTWNAIKASCVMAGWDGLSGALTPLKGAAPANNNFVSGDYNRKTGLVGDGSTKYLDSSRNNNVDPQNSSHNAVFVTVLPTIASRNIIGIGGSDNGANTLQIVNIDGSSLASRNRCVGVTTTTRTAGAVNLCASSRNSSASYIFRAGSVNTTVTNTSQVPLAGNVEVFKTTSVNHTDARLAFYSIGESIDLALLDARVTTLIADIDAAIT